MVLVKDDIKKLYRKFLGVSVMSAVVMSLYSIVDAVAIGACRFSRVGGHHRRLTFLATGSWYFPSVWVCGARPLQL